MRPAAAQLEGEAISKPSGEMLLAIPGVDAGQIDVLPAQRRDVFQQRVLNVSSCSLQVRDRAVDIDSIPVYDRTNDEIETGGAEGLTLERSVTDFATLAVEEDGAFEFVRSLALVESSSDSAGAMPGSKACIRS